ncbi:MAG: hypothetical protein ACE145_15785 [Terriglobia bacterium]
MLQRLSFVLLGVILFAAPVWPKWDAQDKAYLVEQFRDLHDQLQTLKTQLETANAQVADLKQNQQQLQAALARQQRTLQEMDQLVSSLRLGHEESISGLKSALAQLRNDMNAGFKKLSGNESAATAGTMGAAPPAPKGYVTDVAGDWITVDLGSTRGMQPGTRLTVYRASDPTQRMGVLEVQQVTGAESSRARIVVMNPGVQPEFGDIVRPE